MNFYSKTVTPQFTLEIYLTLKIKFFKISILLFIFNMVMYDLYKDAIILLMTITVIQIKTFSSFESGNKLSILITA